MARVVHVRVNELHVSACAFGDAARVGKRTLGQIEANDARGPAARKPDRVRSKVALQVDDIFAGEIAESFDILGEFGAYGGRVLEKVLVVVVVASHVQLGAVVPVLLIVGKPLCVAVRFGHFVIVCRWNVGEACPSVPRSYRVDVGGVSGRRAFEGMLREDLIARPTPPSRVGLVVFA